MSAWASNACPIAVPGFARSIIARKSRRRWAQQTCRRVPTRWVYTPYRSVVSTPGAGPARASKAARFRFGRIRSTVTAAVTATHSHAFALPCFQPVSSTFASRPCVWAWAAAWAGASARLTVCSSLLTAPRDTGRSHTSASRVRTARWLSRPTPLWYATVAVSLGPNPVAARGTGAAVVGV